MVTVFQDTSGLAEGISQAGSALGQALGKRAEKQKELEKKQKTSSILGKSLENLDENSSWSDIIKSFNYAVAQGVPIEDAKNAYSLLQDVVKSKLKEDLFLKEENRVFGEGKPAIEGDGKRKYTENPYENMTAGELVRAATSNEPSISKGAKAQIRNNEIQAKKEADLWNYKPTVEFIKSVEEEAKDAEFANEVAKQVIDLVQTGNVSPTDPRNFLAARFGENLPFFFTEEAASLKFLEKLQAKGLKNYFPRPTEREFFFMNSAQAQLGKTNEANLAIANLQKRFNTIPIRMAEIKDEIIEENNGIPPRDLVSRVRKRMKQEKESLITESAAITYEYGDASQKEQARRYLKEKNSPIIEQKPMKLTPQIKQKILKEAGGDPQKAWEIAKKRGYSA